MKNILVVHRERDGFHHKQTRWKNYTLHFVDFCLHYMFRVNDSGEIEGMHASREKMENVIRAISTNTYDAVYCESAEAFLLQFILMKKKCRRIPFIITDENKLERVKMICRWIEKHYQENPFEIILNETSNFWFCYTFSELKQYEEMGMDRERLFYVPCSIYFSDEVFTLEKGTRKNTAQDFQDPLIKSVEGQAVACGNNLRDYETLIKATGDLHYPVHIFSSREFKQGFFKVTENIFFHDYVPLPKLYEILKVARFVIIPLLETHQSAGIATAGLAIGFGKPVIATRHPCLEDYVYHGENGILVKPGDPESLRKALLDFYGNETKQQRMGRNAKMLSDKLDVIAEKNLAEIFRAATSAGGPFRLLKGSTAETMRAQEIWNQN